MVILSHIYIYIYHPKTGACPTHLTGWTAWRIPGGFLELHIKYSDCCFTEVVFIMDYVPQVCDLARWCPRHLESSVIEWLFLHELDLEDWVRIRLWWSYQTLSKIWKRTGLRLFKDYFTGRHMYVYKLYRHAHAFICKKQDVRTSLADTYHV